MFKEAAKFNQKNIVIAVLMVTRTKFTGQRLHLTHQKNFFLKNLDIHKVHMILESHKKTNNLSFYLKIFDQINLRKYL